MEQAEAAIAKANARRPAVLHPVEHGAKTYYDVAEEISQLDQITTGLAVESMVARNELDKIDFIRDEDGIRETASNPHTYLEGNNPDEAQELLDLLVRKVRVDTEFAVIIYNTAIPSAEQTGRNPRGPGGTQLDHPPLTRRGQARQSKTRGGPLHRIAVPINSTEPHKGSQPDGPVTSAHRNSTAITTFRVLSPKRFVDPCVFVLEGRFMLLSHQRHLAHRAPRRVVLPRSHWDPEPASRPV